MWRRRRDDARRGGWGPRASWVLATRRGRGGAERARRVDRRVPAQVALTVPPELARIPAVAGAAPAAAPQGMKGRLGELMPSVFCTACGEANPDGSRFCAHCGTPLVRLSGDRIADTTSTISVPASDVDTEAAEVLAADAAAVAALPPGTALLAVLRGPNAGSRFLLSNDLTLVGRHPDSDIFLDDVTVSRRHAEFYRHGGTFSVRDVGSLNGTYVNRERIEEAILTAGDEVQVGKFRLVFLLGPSAPAEYGGGSQVGG
jgi:FHA domain/zinc-ribbon domain